MRRLDEKPSCEVCRELYRQKGEDPPCRDCLPEVSAENEEVARIYRLVRGQVITFGNRVVDLDLGTVIDVMRLYGVEDQRTCLERIRDLFQFFLGERQG